jgi:hypothetical protein
MVATGTSEQKSQGASDCLLKMPQSVPQIAWKVAGRTRPEPLAEWCSLRRITTYDSDIGYARYAGCLLWLLVAGGFRSL